MAVSRRLPARRDRDRDRAAPATPLKGLLIDFCGDFVARRCTCRFGGEAASVIAEPRYAFE